MTADGRKQFENFFLQLAKLGVLVLFLLSSGTLVSAQQPEQQDHKSLNYGFVSPNTRDDLQLSEAIHGMKSPEESMLMTRARSLGCIVRSRIRAFPSLGSWSDGAENSILLRVRADESTMRYLMSRMGRDAQQKSVLYFHPQPAGEARIYALRPLTRTGLRAMVRILDRVGIEFRTLVPLGRRTIIYVVDLKRELEEKVRSAARRLRARVSSQTGNAEFVGDESSSQAKTVFEKEINSYEKSHPELPAVCQKRR